MDAVEKEDRFVDSEGKNILPPRGAYKFFCQKNWTKQNAKLLPKMFKELSEDEREPYLTKAELDHQRYTTAFNSNPANVALIAERARHSNEIKSHSFDGTCVEGANDAVSDDGEEDEAGRLPSGGSSSSSSAGGNGPLVGYDPWTGLPLAEKPSRGTRQVAKRPRPGLAEEGDSSKRERRKKVHRVLHPAAVDSLSLIDSIIKP